MSTDAITQAIYDTVHGGKMTTKEIAMRIGMTHQTLINKANPNSETHRFSVHEVLAIQMVLNDTRITEAMAEELGMVFLGAVPDQKNLLDSVLDVSRETGEVAARVQEAMADGAITARELEQCAREINEAVESLMTLRAALNRKAKEDAK